MHQIPREEFVPSRRKSLAYIDEDIEVAPGRYIMEPSDSKEFRSESVRAASTTSSSRENYSSIPIANPAPTEPMSRPS